MVRFPDAEMISGAMRRGPLCGGAGRGIGRGVGRAGAVAEAPPSGFAVALTLGRFAGRLGAVGGAPVGRGCPLEPVIVGFTWGRFAGRLEASMAPAGFDGGAPAPLLVGAALAGFAAATGFAGATGFAAAAFAAGFATDFTTGFSADVATGLGVAFGAGFAGAFSAGLAAPPMRRERRPFFSAMGRHVLHEVGDAAAVAPLVVVPGDDLHKLIAHHHRAEGVDD